MECNSCLYLFGIKWMQFNSYLFDDLYWLRKLIVQAFLMGVELLHESDGVLFWAFLIVDIEEYRTQVNPGAYFRYSELLIDRDTQRQFSENICSEDDLRSRIFGKFFGKILACLPLLGFSNV